MSDTLSADELVGSAQRSTLAATEPVFVSEWGTTVTLRVVPPAKVMEIQAVEARSGEDAGAQVSIERTWLQCGIAEPPLDAMQAQKLLDGGGPAVLRLLQMIKSKSLFAWNAEQWALDTLRAKDPGLGLLADLFAEARQEHDLVDFLRRTLAEVPQEKQIVALMDLGEELRQQWEQVLELAKKNSWGETPGTATESTEPVSTNSTAPPPSTFVPEQLGGTSPQL